MNDTCTTHRSRVPRRSFGRVKWGVTTVEDERGPGLDFSLCFVCGSRPWGAAAFHLCLFNLLLKCIKCSPVPASFFPYLSTSLQSYSWVHWSLPLKMWNKCWFQYYPSVPHIQNIRHSNHTTQKSNRFKCLLFGPVNYPPSVSLSFSLN